MKESVQQGRTTPDYKYEHTKALLICQSSCSRRFRYTVDFLFTFTSLSTAWVQIRVGYQPLQSREITYWWIIRQAWQSMENQSVITGLGKTSNSLLMFIPPALDILYFLCRDNFSDAILWFSLIFSQVCALHFSVLNIISHCNGSNFHFHFPPFSYVHMNFSLLNISSPLPSFLTISVSMSSLKCST